MNDDTRRRETPHLPGLGIDGVEPRPACLVQADHRLGEYMPEQRGVDALQAMGDRIGQIP